MSTAPPCVGAILAGGRSVRMGGQAKAFTHLGGRPMIDTVIQRLRAQVSALVLCVDEVDDEFLALGLPLVTDVVRSHRGPLTGLCSALAYLQEATDADWLLLCPCDAPFLPADLAQRLLAGAVEEDCAVASARYAGHPQPTFSAWRVDTFDVIEQAVLRRGQGGLMHMLDLLPHALVDWPEQPRSPFFNVNTPEELAQAAAWLDRDGGQD